MVPELLGLRLFVVASIAALLTRSAPAAAVMGGEELKKGQWRLALNWAKDNFNLQSAPSTAGTFTNIPGATSPCTNSITAPRQSFRLVSP